MEKILLIEDDTEICEMIKRFLHNEGYDVSIANDGESGYNVFCEQHFDLILLDIMI